jgi:hypothetical protein
VPKQDGSAVSETTTGTVTTPRVTDQFRDWLNMVAERNEGSRERSYEIAASQIDKLMGAESLDDIMDADTGGSHQMRDLVDLEMEVFPIDWDTAVMKSSDEYDTPLGVYIQIRGTALIDFPVEGITAGEEILVSTGAPLVIGKLRALNAGGYLPMPLKVVGVKGGKGTVLKLGRVPNRVVKV